jgi:hypothetical protein
MREIAYATRSREMTARLLWLILCLAPVAARAGLCSEATREPRDDFEFLAGYSPDTSTFLVGRAPDRQFAIAGFAYSYRCWLRNSVAISYTATVLPAAILFQPKQTYYIPAPAGAFGIFYAPAHIERQYHRRESGHR